MIQMELCDDITEKTWNSGKEKMKHQNRELLHQEQSPEEKNESPRGNKNKIYCMLILHQIKLMTSNGFGILLILLEKIDERNSATWEGLPRTTSRIETRNELI